jgi:hypothetical protein
MYIHNTKLATIMYNHKTSCLFVDTDTHHNTNCLFRETDAYRTAECWFAYTFLSSEHNLMISVFCY